MTTLARAFAWRTIERLFEWSIRSAVDAEGLAPLQRRLTAIVPDISAQYTGFEVSGYVATKVRAQHAFQISLIEQTLTQLRLTGERGLTVLDIGDSAGTHLAYLNALHPGLRSIGVNLDPLAVEKIRARGFEALHCRAEELAKHVDRADVLLSFEMIEHLVDPISFLRQVSYNVACKAFIVTVPYVTRSRIKLEYIRAGARFQDAVSAESTHVFELAPEDWRRIFQFSGWSVLSDRIYLQYPRIGLARVLAPLWRRLDFEGFYGAVLVPDHSWSDRYPW